MNKREKNEEEQQTNGEAQGGALTKSIAGAGLPAVSKKQLAAALRQTKDENTSGGGGIDYLKFSGKTGRYSLGRDGDDVEGEYFIVDPANIVAGWVLWKRSKAVKKHRWSAFSPDKAIPEHELDDPGELNERSGDGWYRMMGIGMLQVLDTPKQIVFETNSASGRNVVGDLVDEIASRLEADEPFYPLIVFEEAEAFEAQDQTNYKPVISVEDWLTEAEVAAYRNGETSADDLLGEEEDAPPPPPPPTQQRRARRKAA